MASKRHTWGTNLGYGTNGTNYTDIADMKFIKPPDMSRGVVDVTPLDQADMAKEFLPGWIDAGKIAFEAWFDETVYGNLDTLLFQADPAGSLYFWRVNLPLLSTQLTRAKLTCRGILSVLQWSEGRQSEDDAYHAICEIKVSGVVTFTPGSA